MTILLIDDEMQLRDLLRGILHAACPEAEVLETGDLYHALELVKAADVILCDGHFPKGAMTTTREVQQNPWLSVWAYAKGKRFALLTGDPLAEACARALGITVFLKPCRIADVLAFVHSSVAPVCDRREDVASVAPVCDRRVDVAAHRAALQPGENPVVVEMDRQNERISDEQQEEIPDWRRRRKTA